MSEGKKSPSQLFKHMYVCLCSTGMKPKHATMDPTLPAQLDTAAGRDKLPGGRRKSLAGHSSDEPSTSFMSPTAPNKVNPTLILAVAFLLLAKPSRHNTSAAFMLVSSQATKKIQQPSTTVFLQQCFEEYQTNSEGEIIRSSYQGQR